MKLLEDRTATQLGLLSVDHQENVVDKDDQSSNHFVSHAGGRIVRKSKTSPKFGENKEPIKEL
jgi:hypothetical protein